MNLFTLIAGACLATISGLTHAGEPVNSACPIGKEAIIASAGTVTHEGHEIGLCCPGCADAFNAWEDSRKDGFVELAMAGKEPGAVGRAAPAQDSSGQAREPRDVGRRGHEGPGHALPHRHMHRGRRQARLHGRADQSHARGAPRPLLLRDVHTEVRGELAEIPRCAV